MFSLQSFLKQIERLKKYCEYNFHFTMSEVEGQDQPPAEIVPSKSEDKLEIEKEEKEDKQKAEDIVGEMFSEDKKEETKSEDTPKEESSDKTDKTEEKVEETSENKEEEKTETKDKKFNLPKIKAPKIINEIRSRSKSREKKKVIIEIQ